MLPLHAALLTFQVHHNHCQRHTVQQQICNKLLVSNSHWQGQNAVESDSQQDRGDEHVKDQKYLGRVESNRHSAIANGLYDKGSSVWVTKEAR